MRPPITTVSADAFEADVAAARDADVSDVIVQVTQGGRPIDIGPRPPSPVIIAEIALADVALEPRFVARIPNAQDHGAYLEAAHESTYRTLAVIHLMLAKGDVDGATDLLRQLRDHLDALWTERKVAAGQGVRP